MLHFDDIHSPKYQKFKTDKLPIIKPFIKQDFQFLLAYYEWKYAKPLKTVQRRNGKTVRRILFAHFVGQLIIISMIIMVVMANSNAKYVVKLLLQVNL